MKRKILSFLKDKNCSFSSDYIAQIHQILKFFDQGAGYLRRLDKKGYGLFAAFSWGDSCYQLRLNPETKVIADKEICEILNSFNDLDRSLSLGYIFECLKSQNKRNKKTRLLTIMKTKVDKLNISKEEKEEIKDILNIYMDYNKAEFRKIGKIKEVLFSDDSRKEISMPVKQSFFFDEDQKGKPHVVLLMKEVLHRAPSKKVRGCIDISNGEHLVRRHVTKDEKKLFDLFAKEGISGVPKTRFIRNRVSEVAEKLQLIQKRYDGNLVQMKKHLNFEQKMMVAKSLLKTLKQLHSLKSINDDKEFSHQSIDPNCILLSKNKNKVEAVMGGYGHLFKTESLYKIGYHSPEVVRERTDSMQQSLINNIKPYKPQNFGPKLAQKADVWSLGLVFLFLFDNENDSFHPNLQRYQYYLKNSIERLGTDRLVHLYTQEDVNFDIYLRKSCQSINKRVI